MKYFQRAYLSPFPRLGVFAFTEVNIHSNSKLHPPTKIFWIHSWPEVSTHKSKMCEQNASYLVKDSE